MLLVFNMKKNKNKNIETKVKVLLPFVIIVIIIFLVVISLSWKNITRLFVRLGIGPTIGILATPPTNFTYKIPSSDLRAGTVVHYWGFANDSTGNTNTTNSTPGVFRSFTVIYPETITSVEILNSSLIPNTRINKNQNFYVRMKLNNSRMSNVDAWISFQILDPNGVVVKPLDSSTQYSHTSGSEQIAQIGYTTTSSEWFIGNGYTAEVRIFNYTYGISGGFRICTTRNATFDIV